MITRDMLTTFAAGVGHGVVLGFGVGVLLGRLFRKWFLFPDFLQDIR